MTGKYKRAVILWKTDRAVKQRPTDQTAAMGKVFTASIRGASDRCKNTADRLFQHSGRSHLLPPWDRQMAHRLREEPTALTDGTRWLSWAIDRRARPYCVRKELTADLVEPEVEFAGIATTISVLGSAS
jgi:ribosomal protein L35